MNPNLRNASDLAGRILLAVPFLVAGLWTRAAALALAAFSVLAALIFHANFGDQMQQILLPSDLAVAGGFLVLAANGGGAWSVDARRAAHSKGVTS